MAFFCRGDVLTLLDDIQELKPTIFVSVPRLYNRIYDKVMQAIDSGNALSRALFHRAYNSKQAAFQAGDLTGGRFGPFWDRLVFSKVRERLGGQSDKLNRLDCIASKRSLGRDSCKTDDFACRLHWPDADFLKTQQRVLAHIFGYPPSLLLQSNMTLTMVHTDLERQGSWHCSQVEGSIYDLQDSKGNPLDAILEASSSARQHEILNDILLQDGSGSWSQVLRPWGPMS